MAYAFRNILSRFVLVLGVLALLTTMVWAQAGTGELTGLVADPSGAVVPNAQVTLTNSATGDKRTTVTTPAGVYRFSSLPIVGAYTLEVAPKGFKAVKISNIVISVGTTVSQDVKLEVGTGSEEVTVEAGAEVIQTTESSLSQLVDRNIWQNMPLQVRNQNSFIELVPGAVPQDGTNNNRGAEVNGTRGGAGSYLVDGADNNEQGQAGRGQISFYDKGGASTSISPDAIQEYRVITNSFSAEYGKGGGFITDTVLKSGTNSWHGSAFEYNRIQKLTANDWFSNHATPRVEDHLVRNQFGGSLGGPIVKDKTFWYGTGEIHRVRQSYPQTGTSTTQQFLDFVQSGAFQQYQEGTGPYAPGSPLPTSSPGDPPTTYGICIVKLGSPCPGAFGAIPANGSVPATTGSTTIGPIFSALHSNPALNYPVAASGTHVANGAWTGPFQAGLVYPVPVYGQITVNDPTSQDEARFSVKVDHKFSDHDQFSAVYLFQDATYLDKFLGGNNLIGPAYIQDGRGQNVGLSWTHTLNPTVLNTFRVGYLRHRNDFPSAPGVFGTPGYYTIDGVSVDLGSSTGIPQFFTDNQFQYLDTISVVHGKHSFKFGGEYRRTRNGSSFHNDQFQTIAPWGIEDTLTDLAFSDQADQVIYGGAYYGGAYYVSASVNPTNNRTPEFYRGYRANEFAGFGQDDWRISNRLTLNLGLRWEYFGPPHNFKPNVDSNFYFGSLVTPVSTVSINPFFPRSDPFYAGVANGDFQMRNHEIWGKDTNNFSPRAGFAWDVFGNQRFVVRAGAGLMYDRIYNNVFENIRFNPPLFSDNQVGPLRNGLTAGPISTPGLVTFPFTSVAQYNNPAFNPLPNPRHMDQNVVAPYYEQAHFGFQWEFVKGYVFEPEYVTTMGHKLLGLRDINTFDGRRALGNPDSVHPCPHADPADNVACRPNIHVGADNFRSNGFDSNYHALQLILRKTYSSGLTFNGSYTYSKALDDVSDLFNNGAGLRPTDNMVAHLDYGRADFDTRQRVVATISYDLPFLRSNRWLGGWGTNSIIAYQTGHPWTPFNSQGPDTNKDGYRTDRLVPESGIISNKLARGGPAFGLADTNWISFTCPASVNDGLWCNSPIKRNSLIGPAGADVDFNVTKNFKINERAGVTFQANFFNLFNHPNFIGPTAGPGGSSNFSASDFSKSRTTWSTGGGDGGHRVTQLALRFDF